MSGELILAAVLIVLVPLFLKQLIDERKQRKQRKELLKWMTYAKIVVITGLATSSMVLEEMAVKNLSANLNLHHVTVKISFPQIPLLLKHLYDDIRTRKARKNLNAHD